MIATPTVATEGTTPGYRKIQELLPGLDPAGLELEDTLLTAPDSRRYQSMLALAEGSPRIIAGDSWLRKADAVVYRWSPAALRARVEPPPSQAPLPKAEIEEAWEHSGAVLVRQAEIAD